MQPIRWTTGIVVALFMSGLMQLPPSSINPAYATEGAGGNADDGGGDKGRITVVSAPSTSQVTASTSLNDSHTAPIAPATSRQLAEPKPRMSHDRDQPKRDRDHSPAPHAGDL